MTEASHSLDEHFPLCVLPNPVFPGPGRISRTLCDRNVHRCLDLFPNFIATLAWSGRESVTRLAG